MAKIKNLNAYEELEIIDPLESEFVWASPDEECNSACHGERWRENAAK